MFCLQISSYLQVCLAPSLSLLISLARSEWNLQKGLVERVEAEEWQESHLAAPVMEPLLGVSLLVSLVVVLQAGPGLGGGK